MKIAITSALRPLAALIVSLAVCQSAAAMIFVSIPGMGDMSVKTESRMEATGLNVEPGEGDDGIVTLSLVRSETTAEMLRLALEGAEFEDVEILVAQPGREGEPVVYLKYKLDRCFVKSWSTSGDADDRPTEEVSFYYNKIAFSYARTKDGKEWH